MKTFLPPFAGVLASGLGATATFAQPTVPAKSDEIVVTAQRSGIPVWRVRSGASTVVLVGTIDGVAQGSDWKPDQLAAALRGADQVMFPEGTQYQAGALQMLRVRAQVKKLEYLPRGQTLHSYLSPRQMSRIASLENRGLVQPGFATRRPMYIAYDLIERAKGERNSGGVFSVSRVDWKTDPEAFVRYTASKFHLRMAPMRTERLSTALDQLARIPPDVQLPCLFAAADLAEAPAGTYQARSQAWVQRRVPEVVSSPAEKAFRTCATLVRHEPDPRSALVQALHQPLTTVAVVGLSTLAMTGGTLDYLAAQGFEISGPRWKR